MGLFSFLFGSCTKSKEAASDSPPPRNDAEAEADDDIRTVPPGRTEKQDAIAAAIDHVSGYSIVVIYPYTFDAAQKFQVGAPFAVKGAQEIFTP